MDTSRIFVFTPEKLPFVAVTFTMTLPWISGTGQLKLALPSASVVPVSVVAVVP